MFLEFMEKSDYKGGEGTRKTNIQAGLPKKGGGTWTTC